MTDGWRSYRQLGEDENYIHRVIIHERNFVNPEDSSIHTQNIENLWMLAKRKAKAQNGMRENDIQSYLFEFMFMKKFNGDKVFNEVLKSIAIFY